MKSQVLASYELGILNCFALVLFFAIFCGALAWVYRKSSKEFYDYMRSLPLDNE